MKEKKNIKQLSVFRKWRWLLLFFILPSLWQVPGAGLRAQDVDHKAYTLFLYNFMKYVESPDPSGDFVIGVVGDSPIKKELEVLAQTKKAKGRNIVVKSIATAEEAILCNMIYIPASKSSLLKPIVEKIKGKAVLIVAEREGLAKKGAGISFAISDDDALQFDINKSVLDGQSLKIANLLMQLGILVG